VLSAEILPDLRAGQDMKSELQKHKPVIIVIPALFKQFRSGKKESEYSDVTPQRDCVVGSEGLEPPTSCL
jgi:hypothetical protein